MATARYLSPYRKHRSAVYHCISRVVDRRFILGDTERELFVGLMRNCEAFYGVKILSYCVMSNHFHLLVEVPKEGEVEISDDEFLRRVKALYSPSYYAEVKQIFYNLLETASQDAEGNTSRVAADNFKRQYTNRMHDLGNFMKSLKQRFSRWYNRHNNRDGYLWSGRYTSVLVQAGYVARIMSTYIDLNPVRAGMVEKPEDYRWCSYGAALAGDKRARRGLCRVLWLKDEMPNSAAENQPWDEENARHYWTDGCAERYRVLLYTDAEQTFKDIMTRDGQWVKSQVRKGIRKDEIEKVAEANGQVNMAYLLRHKVRHFSDGMAIGSQSFLNEVFQQTKEWFGEKRKSGARKMKSKHWSQSPKEVCAMRDLQQEPPLPNELE
ncbi:transposase [Persicirhabdus sediminis]|uniref:Transposase n=1 Tax=Persicirhabdus sediminis TaxID=454144 RepID=A0A8J7MIV7_9BACT|nr:transposase [Persicirhabdus sediminis]MBK1792814.1 transposase [Persicirhabdus sediminis]